MTHLRRKVCTRLCSRGNVDDTGVKRTAACTDCGGSLQRITGLLGHHEIDAAVAQRAQAFGRLIHYRLLMRVEARVDQDRQTRGRPEPAQNVRIERIFAIAHDLRTRRAIDMDDGRNAALPFGTYRETDLPADEK